MVLSLSSYYQALDLLHDYWVVICIYSRNWVGVSCKYCVLVIKDYDWSQMKWPHSFDGFLKTMKCKLIQSSKGKNTGLNKRKK